MHAAQPQPQHAAQISRPCPRHRGPGVESKALLSLDGLFQATARALRPPLFDFKKLTTTWLADASRHGPLPPAPRRYTLTHHDVTGALQLSVGPAYNRAQIGGWYTRLIRDEVLAEWRTEGPGARPALHVHCHVSGEERWLAPPALRDFIFQRELPLVLDTLCYADRDLFSRDARLLEAPVYVHLASHVKALNRTVSWGILGRRDTWPLSPPDPGAGWQARWQLRQRFTAEVSEAVPAAGPAAAPAAVPALAAGPSQLPGALHLVSDELPGLAAAGAGLSPPSRGPALPPARAAQPPPLPSTAAVGAASSGAQAQPALSAVAVEPSVASTAIALSSAGVAEVGLGAEGARPGEGPASQGLEQQKEEDDELCEVTWQLHERRWHPLGDETCGGPGGVVDRESFVAGFRRGVQAERQGQLGLLARELFELGPPGGSPGGSGEGAAASALSLLARGSGGSGSKGSEGGWGEGPLGEGHLAEGEVVTATSIVAKWLQSGAEVVSVRRGRPRGGAAPAPPAPAASVSVPVSAQPA